MYIIDFFKKIISIKIKDDLYKNKDLKSFLDIYEYLGINVHMNNFIKETKESNFVIANIHANKETIEKLYTLIKANLKKDKVYKLFNETKLLSMAAMDFLNYSPSTDKNIPADTIIILKPNNKNYTKYTK